LASTKSGYADRHQRVLKKSMDVQAARAMILLESVVDPMAAVSAPAPAPVVNGAWGQNIDVSV
jgi:hypothetical protein